MVPSTWDAHYFDLQLANTDWYGGKQNNLIGNLLLPLHNTHIAHPQGLRYLYASIAEMIYLFKSEFCHLSEYVHFCSDRGLAGKSHTPKG